MTQRTKPVAAPDWERIEFDYRAGILTLREIAEKHGLTHGAVNKRAKRDGWERDLTAKIRAKADALVSKATVSSEVSKSRADTERETVDSNADAIATVVLRQRKDLTALTKEQQELLAELSWQRENLESIERATEILAAAEDGADAGELRKAVHRALGLGGRVNNLKALAEIAAKLIPLERTVWKIDGAERTESRYEQVLWEALEAANA